MPLKFIKGDTVEEILHLYTEWETRERDKRNEIIRIEQMRRPDIPPQVAEMRFSLQVSNLQLIEDGTFLASDQHPPPYRGGGGQEGAKKVALGYILYFLHN